MDRWMYENMDSLLAHPWVAFIRQPAGRLLAVIELHRLGWMNKKLILIQIRRRRLVLACCRRQEAPLFVFSFSHPVRHGWRYGCMKRSFIHCSLILDWHSLQDVFLTQVNEYIASYGWIINFFSSILVVVFFLCCSLQAGLPRFVFRALSLSHTRTRGCKGVFGYFFRFFLRAEFIWSFSYRASVIPLHLNLELSLTAAYSVSVEGASALQQVLEGRFQWVGKRSDSRTRILCPSICHHSLASESFTRAS
jgi:hypothetical protein